MSKKFVKKNIELSLEFDRYLVKHPDELAKIPQGACVFITQKGDQVFSQESKSLAAKIKQKCIEARKERSQWILLGA